MIDKEILDEIASLDFLRLQKVSELFNSTLVLECYSRAFKRLFLVFDHNPKTRTLHVQQTRPQGFKTKSLFILLLNKYVVGKHLVFYRVQETDAIRANFIHDDHEYSLIFEVAPRFAAGLFRDHTLVASLKKDIVPTEAKHQANRDRQLTNVLDKNFVRAREHEKIFAAFHQSAVSQHYLESLRRVLKKKQKLLKNVEGDLLKCTKALSLSHQAELLRANMHLAKRGVASITVMDYSKAPPIETTIPLDPATAPKDVLEKTFNKIKRAKRGIAMVTSRIAEIKEGIEHLAKQIADFEEGNGVVQLDDQTRALQPTTQRKASKERLPYRTYLASDNTKILVGRSAKDSDELTLHHAKGNDWWFHSRDITGAHVVVRSSSPELAERTLIEAALLAAYFSKDRESNHVTVQYTRVKFLRKPKGLAPGKILVSQEKTIDVKVDRELINELLSREQRVH